MQMDLSLSLQTPLLWIRKSLPYVFDKLVKVLLNIFMISLKNTKTQIYQKGFHSKRILADGIYAPWQIESHLIYCSHKK
jgi:hypothetical protein